MARDYFSVLGLNPGRHDPREITRRFHARRERLLAELDRPATQADARMRLDELHIAYNILRDPQRQAEHLRQMCVDDDGVIVLRRLIDASLEDGLLRCSRRQFILHRARDLGFNEFQTQLLIAQVQFGDHEIPIAGRDARRTRGSPGVRPWSHLAAVGLLALALFLYLVRWAGV